MKVLYFVESCMLVDAFGKWHFYYDWFDCEYDCEFRISPVSFSIFEKATESEAKRIFAQIWDSATPIGECEEDEE